MALADIDGDGDPACMSPIIGAQIRTTGLPLLKINGQLSIRQKTVRIMN
jgi:hypothetical protein